MRAEAAHFDWRLPGLPRLLFIAPAQPLHVLQPSHLLRSNMHEFSMISGCCFGLHDGRAVSLQNDTTQPCRDMPAPALQVRAGQHLSQVGKDISHRAGGEFYSFMPLRSSRKLLGPNCGAPWGQQVKFSQKQGNYEGLGW